MGAQVAAHFANAGVPTLLLDVTREAAQAGFERARALRPDPFFTPTAHALIRTGGLDDDVAGIAESDWIIEAVVERLDVKQALFERIEAHRRANAVVSTNTSGIPISALGERTLRRVSTALSRYPLLQPSTISAPSRGDSCSRHRPSVVDAICAFADHRLGKGVVIAKDTPNFIANHLGLYGVMQAFRALATGEYTIEEIDAITGPAIGRPKSATFRTLDIAGLDVLAHVARNLSERLDNPDDRALFAVPPLVEEMVRRGWTGAKAGQGFYKRAGDGEILTLDPGTMEYRPREAARLSSLDAARTIESVSERVQKLLGGQDKVARFLRDTLVPTLDYAERIAPAIAHAPADVIARCAGGSGGSWARSSFAAKRPGRRRCWAQPGPAASCAAMRAPASWTSAMACSASSSIRR